ncbi:DUF3017 domain-containing protein [Amycolatopsis sp. PS_44_ISF1]|uniref:DUF3017 domain-containing protein n=1 Tax=Amycolatopsis sp. PS_44_ISF1 TaxID=2974917 RepID=UPI0028DF4ADC|nr:DUF3017 domain-containing protein [Amycolatopsis sp. PS_44_ISF1]MDT8909617.1 DUF3017 domain-containing protein [Amycolatopsis sp. PS_44_ISF1]
MAMAGGRRRDGRGWTVHAPFAGVLLLVAVGALRIVQYHWREGAVLVGLALFAAGLLRALLPTEKVGLLAIRGRTVDIVTCGLLGAAVLYIALTISGGPFDA